jgi:hypothetical protein
MAVDILQTGIGFATSAGRSAPVRERPNAHGRAASPFGRLAAADGFRRVP